MHYGLKPALLSILFTALIDLAINTTNNSMNSPETCIEDPV